jgi:hypothetical protein
VRKTHYVIGTAALRGAARTLEDHHLVAGLRRSGMVAPWVLDGPINRDAFTVYVRQVLVPELKPGDIVVMDNLSLPSTACGTPSATSSISTPPGCANYSPRRHDAV